MNPLDQMYFFKQTFLDTILPKVHIQHINTKQWLK